MLIRARNGWDCRMGCEAIRGKGYADVPGIAIRLGLLLGWASDLSCISGVKLLCTSDQT
jgi:hypothetical protein